MSFSTLLHISRPRFWHYVLGPMLIYFASSGFFQTMQISFMKGTHDWLFNLLILFIILGYFTLPANLWIYGRNDIADGDTDKFNTKKGNYESKIEDSIIIKRKLKFNIWLWNIGYLIIGTLLIGILNNYQWNLLTKEIGSMPGPVPTGLLLIFSLLCLILFFITSYLYSCKPLRAKAKPFIDGIMNVLYIITPFTIIVLENQFKFPYPINTNIIINNFLAALFRCIAMHCYSAIPDIEPDDKAGLKTTAVYLGKQNSLLYCGLLYLLSAIFSFSSLGWFSIFGGIIYLTIMIISYKRKDIFGMYKLFPYINLILGFLLFRYIILYI